LIRVLLLTVIVFFSLRLEAQPTVSTGGILNVASYTRAGLPGSSIAQGSMFVVYGGNLGTTSTGALSFPLPKSLDKTSIQVTSGSTTVDAIMIYTTPGQVAGILPSNTPVGAGKLTLTYNNQSSTPVDVQIVPNSFGAFTLNQAGSGPAVIQNYVSATELPVNTITTPATPGQTVILWGTGLGPVSGDEGAAPPTPSNMQTALSVKVWVGTALASVSYAGRSGCCAAIDQVDFVVPQGVEGCYLPVSVEAGGVVSNFTSMAVDPSAGAGCSDADGIDAADLKTLQSAGSVRLGVVDLTHISLALVAGLAPVVSDTAFGVFGTYSAAQMSASLGLTESPSVGSCTVSQFQGLNPVPVDPTKPALLDAGSSLSINGPNGTKTIASTSAGVYAATLGGVPLDQILTATPTPAYFDSGSYTITGNSGAKVGSFSAQIAVPTDVTWTNSSSITSVDRTKDLTITWTGGGQSDFVAISGTASVTAGGLGPAPTSPGNAFLCIAPATAGTFTVPSWVLQTLPSTKGQIAASFLLVGTQTPVSKFSASGLDDGYVVYRSLTGNGVPFE
jgi:uncharacterized protein (TIGR03437 family)